MLPCGCDDRDHPSSLVLRTTILADGRHNQCPLPDSAPFPSYPQLIAPATVAEERALDDQKTDGIDQREENLDLMGNVIACVALLPTWTVLSYGIYTPGKAHALSLLSCINVSDATYHT